MKRLKKVYIPLLFTCIVTFIIYLALPETYSISESETLHIPQDIHYLHKFEKGSLSVLVPHLLGWKDWYVFCIIIFCSLFYLSSYLTRNKENNQTWVLWLLFIAYFAFAYMSFDPPEAHWYRYCWAFFGGHIYAKMVKSQQYNRLDIAMFALLYSTTFIEGLFMEISYILAIIIIFISAKLCSSYNMLSPVLAFLGGVSYFFYLSHVRIVFAVFTTYGLFSVLIWVLFAILVSWLLKKGYDKLPFFQIT